MDKDYLAEILETIHHLRYLTDHRYQRLKSVYDLQKINQGHRDSKKHLKTPNNINVPLHDQKFLGTDSQSVCSSISSMWTISSSNDPIIKKQCYVTLAKQLHLKNNLDIRLNVLRQLHELILTELSSFDVWWNKFKVSLRLCLGDTHFQVFNLSLKLHVKLLFSGIPSIIKEVFNNLTLFCEQFFLDNQFKNSSIGIDLNDVKLRHLLILFRSIIDFMRSFASHWIRYPTSCVKDIMNNFLELLNISFPLVLNVNNVICPLSCIAIVDPNALWFRDWLKTSFGRDLFQQVFLLNRSIMHKIILVAINTIRKLDNFDNSYVDTKLSCDTCSGKNVSFTYTFQSLQHLCFVSILSMIQEFILYDVTRNFLVECSDKSCVLILKNLIVILKLKCCCMYTTNKSIYLCPPAIISNLLVLLFRNESTMYLFPDIFPDILNSCKQNYNYSTDHFNNFHTFEILNAMLWHELSFNYLTNVQVQNIFDLIQTKLKERFVHSNCIMPHLQDKLLVLGNVIKILLSTNVGIMTLKTNKLLETSFLITHSNHLYNYVDWNYQLSEMAVNYYGCRVLSTCDFVKSFCSSLWNDYFKGNCNDNFDFKIDQNLKRYLNVFCSIYPTIYILKESSREMCESDFDIYDLLERMILFNEGNEGNYASKFVFLVIVNILVTSINASLIIQSVCNITEKLYEMQLSCLAVDDELSYFLNHVITRILVIGGPTERKLSPWQLLEFQSRDYAPGVVSYLPRWEFLVKNKFQSRQYAPGIVSYCWQLHVLPDSAQMDLINFKENYLRILSSDELIYNPTLKDVLLQAVKCDAQKIASEVFAEAECISHESRNAAQMYGIDIAIRYGCNLKLIKPDNTTVYTNFLSVISIIKKMKGENETNDFDFLLATVYLLMKGDNCATISFFENLNKCPHSKYIWYPWRSMCASSSMQACLISQEIKLIMDAEIKEVVSAFFSSRRNKKFQHIGLHGIHELSLCKVPPENFLHYWAMYLNM
ncbi:Protein broad-minded [Nymphon striatum]|nr:Protein broad-minded [Nymphon striatum]